MIFDLELDTILCKKVDDIMIVKLRKDAVQEATIARNASHEVIQVSVISHIAATAACSC